MQREVLAAVIHSSNIGMVVDTGIVLDILRLRPGRPLTGTMFEWISEVAGRVAPAPRGKVVTVFISPGVYRDYRARIGNTGTAAGRAPAWNSFRKSTFKKAIDRQNKTFFSMQPVNTEGVDANSWKGDRFDRSFFTLLAAVGSMRAWCDREIIFASKDRATLAHMRDLMINYDHYQRLHFANDLSSCEELVMH